MVQFFDKDGSGSAELNGLTGQWYASTPYSQIKTEIDSAARELASLVGDEVIDAASEAYLAGTDGEFVDAVRLPVACRAIARFAELSSVSHEGTGRKVKMDDSEKMPFEWMIDRDDRAMRDRYYRAIDSLYWYLDRHQPASWQSSALYGLRGKALVRRLPDFERYYPLDGSYYAFYLFLPLVLEVQESVAEPFVGSELWAKILSGDADSVAAALSSRMSRLIVLTAVSTAVQRWSLDIFPLSVARRFSPSYQGNKESSAAEIKEIDWYVGRLASQIADVKEEIRRIIDSSSAAYLLPENDRRNKFATVV